MEKNLLIATGIPYVDLEKLGCLRLDRTGKPCVRHSQFKQHCSLCDESSYRDFVLQNVLGKE